MSYARIILLTSLAMLAFASNSLLCRIALKHTDIDAASFTTIRLISGALTLGLVVRIRRGTQAGSGNWLSAAALFVYAAGFSFAYMSLPAATGALMLFGAVQVTMIGYGIWSGERLLRLQLIGLMLAFGGTRWSITTRPLGATTVRLPIDVGCRSRLGRLFFTWERGGQSYQGDSGKFHARHSYCGNDERIDV